MEPVRTSEATLNDLLDRLLTVGIVLDLDLIIGVAGIPLIGVSLRAAIAAIETMIEYGLLQTWDEKTREYAERELQRKKLVWQAGEEPLFEMFGSHWYSDGVYRAWRPGRLHLTSRRLLLYRRMPAEILFEVPLASIRGISVAESVHFNGRRVPLLHLVLESGEETSLYAEDVGRLAEALLGRLEGLGVPFSLTADPGQRDREVALAVPGAKVLAEAQMWRLDAGASADAAWEPGRLFLTSEGLLWWSATRRRIDLQIAAGDIVGVCPGVDAPPPPVGAKSALAVRFVRDGGRETEQFTGKALDEWRRAVRRVVVDHEGGTA